MQLLMTFHLPWDDRQNVLSWLAIPWTDMHIRRYILGWASCMYIIACACTITRKTKSTCDQHVACVSLHVMIYLHLPSVSLHLVQLHWEKKNIGSPYDLPWWRAKQGLQREHRVLFFGRSWFLLSGCEVWVIRRAIFCRRKTRASPDIESIWKSWCVFLWQTVRWFQILFSDDLQ